jgi:membrane fusion protein, multidrug efflux system
MRLIIKISLSVMLAVIALLITGCNKKNDKKNMSTEARKVQAVKTLVLKEQSIARSQDFASTLEAYEQVDLVPNIPGKVKKIKVEVGSKVAAGQILVEMDQTNLFQARVQLANLKTELNRMTILLQSGSVSQQAYDQAKTQYDVAKSNVDNLETNTFIRAPFSGVISGKYMESGEMYSGTPVASIGKAAIVSLVQINQLKAFINVPETYLANVKVGQSPSIQCDVFPDKKIKGQIIRIYPTIDPTTHTFQVEIKVPNAGNALKPGMFCRALLDLGLVKALMVPAQAVLKTQGSNERYVFINDKGVAKRVTVVLGQRYNDRVEIISNEISDGASLVIEGQGRLLNGDKLKEVN